MGRLVSDVPGYDAYLAMCDLETDPVLQAWRARYSGCGHKRIRPLTAGRDYYREGEEIDVLEQPKWGMSK